MEYEARDIVFILLPVLFEALCLGAFAALTCVVVWMLITKRHELRLAQKLLFWASIGLFLLAGTQIGFVVHQFANGPNIPAFNVRAQVVLYGLILALGDAILIWRLWSIWEHDYIVVLVPLALTLTTATLTFREAIRYRGDGFFQIDTGPPLALSATNTTLCTILIAGRIWYMRRRIRRIAGPSGRDLGQGLMSGALFLIETGALFTCSQILVLIFKRLGSAEAFSFIMNLEMPLIGILPTLLIVLVYFQKLPGASNSRTYGSHTMTSIQFTHRMPVDKTLLGYGPETEHDRRSSLTRVASGSSGAREMV